MQELRCEMHKTTWPSDPILEYLEKHYPGRIITAEDYISMNGIPVEEYGGERLAEVPRKFRRRIERLAERAQRKKINESLDLLD
jgi:hypothetical protein